MAVSVSLAQTQTSWSFGEQGSRRQSISASVLGTELPEVLYMKQKLRNPAPYWITCFLSEIIAHGMQISDYPIIQVIEIGIKEGLWKSLVQIWSLFPIIEAEALVRGLWRTE